MDTEVTALILAGGRGRRMGGVDKGLIKISGRPIVEHIVEQLQSQCSRIIINANRNQARYKIYGYQVVTDTLGEFEGPLAGFAAGMKHAKTPFLTTLPCDAPLLTEDFIARMKASLEKNRADIAVAHDGKRMQPVYAILKTRMLNNLEAFLESGERKIDRWYAQNNTITVDFSDSPHIFKNINTPEQQISLANTTGK